MVLICNFSVILDIYTHALEDPTVEICGALLGQQTHDQYWYCTDYVRMNNITVEKAEVHYTPDPQDLFGVLQRTTHMNDDAEDDLVGIAHTHPRHQPIPSETDLKYAGYKGVYIIYSPIYNSMLGWYFDGKTREFKEAQLIIQN